LRSTWAEFPTVKVPWFTTDPLIVVLAGPTELVPAKTIDPVPLVLRFTLLNVAELLTVSVTPELTETVTPKTVKVGIVTLVLAVKFPLSLNVPAPDTDAPALNVAVPLATSNVAPLEVVYIPAFDPPGIWNVPCWTATVPVVSFRNVPVTPFVPASFAVNVPALSNVPLDVEMTVVADDPVSV
jgi:hypothetical protein